MTFDRSVNIKETCWNLQNVRVTPRASGAPLILLTLTC